MGHEERYETNRLEEKGLCGVDWDNTTDGDWIILSPLLIGNARDLWIFAGQYAPSFDCWIIKEVPIMLIHVRNFSIFIPIFSCTYWFQVMHKVIRFWWMRLSTLSSGCPCVNMDLYLPEETDLKNLNKGLDFGQVGVAKHLTLGALPSKVCGVGVLMVLSSMYVRTQPKKNYWS